MDGATVSRDTPLNFVCGVTKSSWFALLGILVVASAATSARRAHGPAVTKTCSAAEHARRARAVAAYRKAMPKQRAAYFRKHTKTRQRAAFVKAQQAKLGKLKRAV